ncbi:protein lethal(2)k10201 [Anopheles merus]|uniref:C2H2-type domain-containing protein n=1 Tax=Anopheles merus TaxID=30066 RepID=A0A182UTG6_ANOME|nr:protein lethal(2)k10201 [Anopheles merus]
MEYTAKETVLSLLQRYADGPRRKDDEFFREGNFYLKPFAKLGVLSKFPFDDTEPEDDGIEISCNVPDCNFFCHSVKDYEAHYNAQHRYTCGQCKKSLPNAHLLDLHLSETHDSYFAAQVQSASRAMYACFLEECKHRSKDPAERRDHCIREHRFPHNFRFDMQQRASQPNKSDKQPKATVAMETESAAGSMTSPLTEEPSQPIAPKCRKNFSFGHPQQRTFKTKAKATGGTAKPSAAKCDILESNQMVIDLLDSLPQE